MTMLVLLFLTAARARPGDVCEPPGDTVYHRWPLDEDGTDTSGTASLTVARGAGFRRTRSGMSRPSKREAALQPGEFLEGDVDLPESWNEDFWFFLDDRGVSPPGDPSRLVATVSWDGHEVALELDCLEARLRADGAVVDRTSPPTGLCGSRFRAWIGVRAVEGTVVALVENTRGVGVVAIEADIALPTASTRYTIRLSGSRRDPPADDAERGGWLGPGRRVVREVGATLRRDPLARVDDLVIRGGDIPPADRRARGWCQVLNPRPDEPWRPFEGPKLELDGYYLGGFGHAHDPSRDEPDWVARQRLVVTPDVQLSRGTHAIVQIRMLEASKLASTGSMLGDPNGASSRLQDWLPFVEQAWITQGVRETTSGLQLLLAAGRLPTAFGIGIAQQNTFATLDTPPFGPSAAFFDPDVDFGIRAEPWGERSFGDTLDGVMPAIRGAGRHGNTWLTVQGGRRNSRCAGRQARWCNADGEQLVYEWSATATSTRKLRSRNEGVGQLSLQLGGRWPDQTETPFEDAAGFRYWFGRVAQAAAVDGTSWIRLHQFGELDWEHGVLDPTGGAQPIPVELRGGFFGAAGYLDFALRDVQWLTLTVAGGAAKGHGDGPARGMHPDHEVDLVGFANVVARASSDLAAASGREREPTPGDPSTGGAVGGDPGGRAPPSSRLEYLPSLGGVYEGYYFRTDAGFRVRRIVDLTAALVLEHTDLEVVPILGPEVDGGLRVNAGPWRIGVQGGWMTRELAIEGTPTGAAHPWTFAARLGRNL